MPERAHIFIGTPHHRDMEPEYVMSVYKTAVILSKIGVTVDYMPWEGGIISAQRNELVKKFLEGSADYLLFCDADSCWQPFTVTEMLDADKPIIGSLYRLREEPFLPVVYNIAEELEDGYFRRLSHEEIPNEPFVCGAVGAGLLLIKRVVLEKIMEETFVKQYGFPFNLWQRPDGVQLGEDMSFSMRARIAGFETWCYPSPDMVHMGIIRVGNDSVLTPTFPHYSNDIPGWMSATELNWLYQTAKGMKSIIEIGCWKGRSTLALLNACRGQVYAVDTFKGSWDELEGPHREAVTGDVKAEFETNTMNFRNLTTLTMTSEEASNCLGPKVRADMIFIDGSHRYEDILQDIRLWVHKARKLICGHDYNWPGVQKAVNDMFDEDHYKGSGTIWCHKCG